MPDSETEGASQTCSRETKCDRPAVPPCARGAKEEGKTVKIVGGIVGGFIVLSAIGAALPQPQEAPAPAAIETPADTTDGKNGSRRKPTEPTQPEPSTAPEIVGPEFTVGQENAIAAAESYIDTMPFSKTGLIDQLKYEKYASADARFAVNHIAVDWNEQAAKAAESYLDTMPFSRQGLIDQLEFEGFTTQQAIYGVSTTGL